VKCEIRGALINTGIWSAKVVGSKKKTHYVTCETNVKTIEDEGGHPTHEDHLQEEKNDESNGDETESVSRNRRENSRP
jgi:hypothetical protein